MIDTIHVPESFRSYLNNPAVRTAVNTLLEKPDKIPRDDFRWPELRQYHEALFSACRVRHDYTIMLFDLMEELCLMPANEKGLKGIPLRDKSCYDKESLPTPHAIWEEGLYYYLNVSKGKGIIGFCLGWDGSDGNLDILLSTEEVELEELQPQDKWSLNEETGWWQLVDTNLSLNSNEINVKEWREAVTNAIDSILKTCEGGLK